MINEGHSGGRMELTNGHEEEGEPKHRQYGQWEDMLDE
jgi:hypothetical protein